MSDEILEKMLITPENRIYNAINDDETLSLDSAITLVHKFRQCVDFMSYEELTDVGLVTLAIDLNNNFSGINIFEQEEFKNFILNFQTDNDKHQIIDLDGNLNEEDTLEENYCHFFELQSLSEDFSEDFLIFGFVGYELIIWYDNQCVHHIDNIATNTEFEGGAKKPVHLYEEVIKNHHENETKYAGELIWDSKSDLELRESPEVIFHQLLLTELKQKLKGEVEPDPRAGTSEDKPDFKLFGHSHDPDKYVIEIKWMGKSTNSSKNEEDAKQGLAQLGRYLKHEEGNNFDHGRLIVYDARGEDVSEICFKKHQSQCHRKIKFPSIILLLKTETASQARLEE